jgi:hypothetical protein
MTSFKEPEDLLKACMPLVSVLRSLIIFMRLRLRLRLRSLSIACKKITIKEISKYILLLFYSRLIRLNLPHNDAHTSKVFTSKKSLCMFYS